MKVGITGQAGFVGTTLYNLLNLNSEIEPVQFEDSYFKCEEKLREFVCQCDVIVHLAAMNRHEDHQLIYDTNVELVDKLIGAMKSERVRPHVIFSSSTQETLDNLYGRSKKRGREMFEQWAELSGASFTGLVVPNVFGELSLPNYNTFIATFAHLLVNGESPTVVVDSDVQLIYVGSLCRFIISQFANMGVARVEIPCDFNRRVTEILARFENFNELYNKQGFIPELKDINDVNLFNTFRSYMEPRCVELVQHVDGCGVVVERVKLSVGGKFNSQRQYLV